MDKKVELETRLEELLKERAPIDRKITNIRNELEKVKCEMAQEKLADMKANGPDWEYLLNARGEFGDHEAKESTYRYLTALFYDMDMGSSSYPTITMTYDSKDSYDKVVEAVKLLAPFMPKYDGRYEEDHNKVVFDIMEHTLSERASYSAAYNCETEKFTLLALRNGFRTVQEFDTVEEGVKYIQENHWYDGREDLYEDEEY